MSCTIIATRKSNFMLEKAQNHIRDLQGINFADPNDNLKVEFNDNKNMNFDSLGSLGNVIERKLGIGELSNRNIYQKCTIIMTLTQTTLMEAEINEIRSTICSGDSSLLIFLVLNSHFLGSSRPEVFLREGVLEVCSKFAGSTRAGVRFQ